MVTTRSGTKVHRHAVHFKKDVDVRRILEYDADSDYDGYDSSDSTAAYESPNTRGISLVNGLHSPHSILKSQHHDSNGSILTDVPPGSPCLDGTVVYDDMDIGRRRHSPLWHLILFVIIVTSCYLTSLLACKYQSASFSRD